MPQPVSLEELRSAKAHAKTLLMSLTGVRGFGIGDGTVRIYIVDASVVKELPGDVDGVPIEPITVGEVTIY